MLKEWQFNVLFFVGVGGAIILLIGPELGLQSSQNPTAVTGIGAILTYVLTQKRSIVKSDDDKKKKEGSGSGSKVEKSSSGDDDPSGETNPIEGDEKDEF